jgi:hypothetical protein
MALASFLQLLRPTTMHEQRAQRTYSAEVQSVLDKVRAVFDAWLDLREHESDNFELANSAAVYRWELMRLAKSTEHLTPPRSFSGIHREVHNAVVGAARACQLLANGYRGHKSEAVCDGQALLVETVADLTELNDQLKMRA